MSFREASGDTIRRHSRTCWPPSFRYPCSLENDAYTAVPELDRLIHRIFGYRTVGEKVIIDYTIVAARRFHAETDRDIAGRFPGRASQPDVRDSADIAQSPGCRRYASSRPHRSGNACRARTEPSSVTLTRSVTPYVSVASTE